MTHRWGCATVFLLGSSPIWSSMNAIFRSWNIFYSSSAISCKSPNSRGWPHSSKKYINPHHIEENSFSEPSPPTQTHSIFRQLSFNGMTYNSYQELQDNCPHNRKVDHYIQHREWWLYCGCRVRVPSSDHFPARSTIRIRSHATVFPIHVCSVVTFLGTLFLFLSQRKGSHRTIKQSHQSLTCWINKFIWFISISIGERELTGAQPTLGLWRALLVPTPALLMVYVSSEIQGTSWVLSVIIASSRYHTW